MLLVFFTLSRVLRRAWRLQLIDTSPLRTTDCDTKGNDVDTKGNGVDTKGNDVDTKGNDVDTKRLQGHASQELEMCAYKPLPLEQTRSLPTPLTADPLVRQEEGCVEDTLPAS
eukprot:4699059-Pyramimonas_sp.AAC.1